jgi:lipopolysaccharide transport system permease protein
LQDVLIDIVRSLRLWRIWLRLGMQDVRLRFRRSALGAAWIFVNLTISILSIGVVYGVLFKLEVNTFIPLLTVGLIAWNYITSSIVDGANAFIASEGYIKQIALPVYVYILRWFVSISLTTLLSLATYIVVIPVFGVGVGVGILWAIPGLALLALASLLAITIFAHVNAHFRDTSPLAGSIMQVLFYITPVIWPAELLRQRGAGQLVDFNPFYHLLEVVRQPLLHSRPGAPINYVVSGALVIAMAVLAVYLLAYYRRRLIFLL